MKANSFKFHYLIVLAFLALSVCFLLKFETYRDNFSAFKREAIGGAAESKTVKATIALADDWGRTSYRQIEVDVGGKERIFYILEALFKYSDTDADARNYINPSSRLLGFRKEGSRVYVSLSNDFKMNQGTRLAVSYSQLKNTIKAEYPDMDTCTIIYPDSVIVI